MERNCNIDHVRKVIEDLDDDDIYVHSDGSIRYVPACSTEVECNFNQQAIINILYDNCVVGYVTINMCFRIEDENIEIDFIHYITLPTNKSYDTSGGGGAQRHTEH